MPHVSSGGGDDLASTDEVKVYKDEGEEEQRAENLSEVKYGLVTETEEDGRNGSTENSSTSKPSDVVRPSPGKSLDLSYPHPYYHLMPPYYQNGSSLASKLPAPGHTPAFPTSLGLAVDALGSPPPAHMGLSRYSLGSPHSQLSALYSSELGSWSGAGYPLGAGFRNPYSSSVPGALMPGSPLSRFSPIPTAPGLPPGISHPTLVPPTGPRHEFPLNLENSGSAFRSRAMLGGAFHDPALGPGGPRHNMMEKQEPPERKRPHIKKPLNAFMLFMKEMRAQVVAECTLKESAAINQILGRKWHALDRSEQAKYYDMARKEKELHMKLYPGWSARDNYAVIAKRKKRRKIEQSERVNGECTSPKKCRARFGLDQQNQWCKHCKRKKKCLRYMQGDDGSDGDEMTADSTQPDDSPPDLSSPESSAQNDSPHTDPSPLQDTSGLHSRPSSPDIPSTSAPSTSAPEHSDSRTVSIPHSQSIAS